MVSCEDELSISVFDGFITRRGSSGIELEMMVDDAAEEDEDVRNSR